MYAEADPSFHWVGNVLNARDTEHRTFLCCLYPFPGIAHSCNSKCQHITRKLHSRLSLGLNSSDVQQHAGPRPLLQSLLVNPISLPLHLPFVFLIQIVFIVVIESLSGTLYHLVYLPGLVNWMICITICIAPMLVGPSWDQMPFMSAVSSGCEALSA